MRGAEHSRLAIAGVFGLVLVASSSIPGVPFLLRLGAIAGAACLLGELFLSPDLDHPVGCAAYRRWWLLRWIWRPYQSAIRHRSPWSHWPVLGTAGRLAYLGVPAFVLAWIVTCGDVSPAVEGFARAHWRELAAAALGLELSALLHLVGDL